MPTISVEQKLLQMLLAKHGLEHDIDRLADELPLLGTDIDSCDESSLNIEIFPDRPDLLSGETLANAIRPFLHSAKSKPRLDVKQGTVTMTVAPELEHVRPVILGAIVRNVDTGTSPEEKEGFIKCLMDHQEKLHFALGRGRRRASIGVHDLSTVTAPFRVEAVPVSTQFTPLGISHPMSLEQILSQHPKGIDYAHLLDGMDAYPIIYDAHGEVLSFPPIINGNHTTVTHATTDFFIDVTGWDRRACESSLMLMALQLAERGGSVESITITGCDSIVEHLPNPAPITHTVTQRLLDGLLGRSLTDEEISTAVNRMGGEFLGRHQVEDAPNRSPKNMADIVEGDVLLSVDMPRWRFDILHPIDLVEDIAIGHGYEDLGNDVPKAPLTAVPRKDGHIRRRIRDSLQGLGLMQIQSLTLSNDHDQFEAMRWPPMGEVTRITNPITIEHTLLRQYLLPGLFRLMASNRHHDLPQAVYELGTVVRDHANSERFAFLVAEQSGGFAAIRGRIQAILRDLGAAEYAIEPLSGSMGPWLTGRSAKVVIDGVHVGCFGEMDPAVSQQYELRVPLNGAEFDISALSSVLIDPV
ncbi:MAG: phenylalanine--tRNA ligase subunit beta [Euryarchaeota archaeon]|nr:phenylalanine--tRNA ligase subunit beta [Euryarchaeota archaeon]